MQDCEKIKKLAIAVGLIANLGLLSGCTYLGDWSNQHHLRLYERYRLVAHHDLLDGRFDDAIASVQRAISELEKADPGDLMARQDSVFELAGMYLACGNPKAALDTYSKTDNFGSSATAPGSIKALGSIKTAPGSILTTSESAKTASNPGGTDSALTEINSEYAAQAAAGKGFCYLKLKQYEKAAQSFTLALQLYKTNPIKIKTEVFPIDLCSDCCAWGLKQASLKTIEPISISIDQPLKSECLSSRFSLARRSTPANVGTVNGANGESDNSGGLRADTTAGAGIQQSRANFDLHSSWNTLLQAGKRSESKKEDAKAERYYKGAINLLRKHKDGGTRMTESLQSLSFFLMKRNRKEEALPYLLEEVKVQEARFGKDDVALAAPLGRYGATLMRSGDLKNAEVALMKSLDLSNRFIKDKTEIAGLIHANVCELRLAQGRHAECISEGRKAIEVLEKVNPGSKGRITTTYFMIANALIAQNRMKEAEKALALAHPMLQIRETPPAMRVNLLLTEATLALQHDDLKSAKLATQDARLLIDNIKLVRANEHKVVLPRLQKRLGEVEKMVDARGAAK
ncbi:MAG: tetratricopeptide repeat protein [Candidatus Melainabacteria bacterium]|nr:tetratricopeptide repeat protein [Candidatus Melainabacteria bacterium]